MARAMELSTREVARLLGRSEAAVRRLAERGLIPAYRVHDVYRFNRVEIQEWALEHNVKIDPALLSGGDGASAVSQSVHAALVRGGIYHDLPGKTPEEVFRHVVDLPGIPEGTDRELLHDLLVTREALGSTGIGDGIAIPHPRSPLVLRVSDPIILLCFLEHRVDFHAVDGQPVQTLLTLLSPTIQTHLRMLANVAHLLHDEGVRSLLRSRASGESILERIRALEDAARPSEIGPAKGDVPVR
jgi:PTS system nitrogen regulatory IIA component